ncbi:MAG: rhomboid family intramembrane serine protease [Bacteroidaceae bacterium]|nr:rhomboid family intramembrane serine protease [Bacteroidaceae bacterium]
MFKNLIAKFRTADIVWKFIYANIFVYIILVLIGVFSVLLNLPSLVAVVKSLLELPASPVTLLQKPWTVFTYMFLHSGIMHILWNMFALYAFGKIFLNFFSIRHFVGVYVLGGLFGALFFVLAYNIFPYFANVVASSYLVGASAAVLAIVTASAVRSPEYRINLLFFGSVKLSIFAVFTVLISVLMLSGDNAGGNFAHLGGAFAGYLFAFLLGKGCDVTQIVNRPLDWIESVCSGKIFKRKKKRKFTYSAGGKRGSDYEFNARKKADEAEINTILEKIKKGGYASLSDSEKKRLFDASSK